MLCGTTISHSALGRFGQQIMSPRGQRRPADRICEAVKELIARRGASAFVSESLHPAIW